MQKIYLYDDNIGLVEYIDHMGNDLKAVNGARNSFGKKSDSLTARDKELLNFLLTEGHLGVLEHNSVTFRFVVPIFVARQFHRHRTWSYNEISRRYTSVDINFYVPKTIRIQDTVNKQGSISLESDSQLSKDCITKIEQMNQQSYNNYLDLINSGVCRELARGVLNHNLYTSFWGTANLRNIINFIKLRKDSHAQYEIQQVAKAVERICEDLYPETMKFYKSLDTNNNG